MIGDSHLKQLHFYNTAKGISYISFGLECPRIGAGASPRAENPSSFYALAPKAGEPRTICWASRRVINGKD